MGAAGSVHLDRIWGNRNVLSKFETQCWLFFDEGSLSFLPILLIREFRKVKISKEKDTLKATVMWFVVVHQGECPPGDQGVGCEHGTHIYLYLTFAIRRQIEASLYQ